MSITDKTRKLLWGRSGNRCAKCKCELVMDGTVADDGAIVGEECHIHAQETGGPRYDPALSPKQLHGYENLILLCGVCHKVVDDQRIIYSDEVLQGLKQQHVDYVRSATEPLDKRQAAKGAYIVSVGLDLIEKEVGIRWSRRVDMPAQTEVIMFRGQLIAQVQKARNNVSTWYELFHLRNGWYVVYSERIHNLDYSEANLFGANAWGEAILPLTLERLQDEFPFLATEAGLSRVREFDPA